MSPAEPSPSPFFVTTRWTRVLQARGSTEQAKAALSDLCAAYYAPVFAFIRRSTPDEDFARELTQDFFARLLAGHSLDTVDPQRGRFRSYLLGAVRHFMADRTEHARRLKRGGGQPLTSIDAAASEDSPAPELPDNTPGPDREFDRKWALTVLDSALSDLNHEFQTTGKSDHFELLKPWLTGDPQHLSQAETARQLSMNEGALKVAIHRLRRRFRDLVKAQIEHTLSDPAQADNELSSLLAAIRQN